MLAAVYRSAVLIGLLSCALFVCHHVAANESRSLPGRANQPEAGAVVEQEEEAKAAASNMVRFLSWLSKTARKTRTAVVKGWSSFKRVFKLDKKTASNQQSSSSRQQRPVKCGIVPVAPVRRRWRREEPAVRAISMKISGGRAAKPNQIPWQARLVIEHGDGAYEQCGATILNSRTLLTAAHCIQGRRLEQLQLTVGEHWLGRSDKAERKIGLIKAFAHPQYDRDDTWRFDFGLLITDQPIAFVGTAPVCLGRHVSHVDFVGQSGTIAGWGRVDRDSFQASQVLRQARVTILSQRECRKRYADLKQIADEMFCAGGRKNQTEVGNQQPFNDACEGDSGGGLTVQTGSGRHVLLGVISFGFDCNNRHLIPGVYGKVSAVMSWLVKNSVGKLHFVY